MRRQLAVQEAVAEAARHLEQGHNERAVILLERALKRAPHFVAIQYLLGVAQIRQKQYEPAIANLRKAVEAEPANVDYLFSLGEALMAEHPVDAIPYLARAVNLGSKNPDAYTRLSTLLMDARNPEAALRICDLGMIVCGPQPGILGNRALALDSLSRYREALECMRRMEAQLPQELTVLVNLGVILRDLGRLSESQSYLERAIAVDPESSAAHYDLGLTLLLAGDLRQGFREYEWRWGIRQLAGHRTDFPQPVWDGAGLSGRRVLLQAEQGAGDTLQFARYADFVRARGGRVVLRVAQPLVRLMRWLADCEVSASQAELPDFDVHCPMLSLPRLAETDRDSIPPPARFAVPPEMIQKWSALLGRKTRTRVGVVWAGAGAHLNDRNRSFPCRLFAPLLEIPGFEWYSLQVGSAGLQLADPGIGGRICNLAPELTDYAETAAAISHLDLVITADTSVAHLAGSLVTPVWMLIPFAPDWRWQLDRDDSPWYPSLRIFRQPAAGDWESVMQTVAAALRVLPRPTKFHEKLDALGGAGASACQSERSSDSFFDPAVVASAPGLTDLARWSKMSNLDPAWNDRARQAADFIPSGAVVLDLGCGRMALEGYLPPGCRYIPCDVTPRDERTLLCDFNLQPVPRPPAVTHIAALGLIEYLHDWPGFLRQLREFYTPVVLSYCPTDFTAHLDRQSLGWVNHLSLRDLCQQLEATGFYIQSSLRPDSNQILLRISPVETRMPVRRRVLVMSYNNIANFGDRLGFHLLNSVMPSGVEVHHGHFQPWDVPPGHFDLLVLGIGNSIFQPLLTDRLLELVRGIPRSVGIFGTQYREAIDGRRMAQLLDNLTVWFARSEEDLLLYGSGRQNAVHLGDWLIGAFPMTHWKLDQTLHIGSAFSNHMALDQTIQGIQQYRSVVSERLHPLLCALTSAERVAYSEQREDGSGTRSGKFRSLLLDIFGRTWKESELVEFPRDAVAAYRARTMRVMSGMPELFGNLLA